MSDRILIADDHPVLRHGLRVLLQQQPNVQVIAEASNGEEAVELSRRLHPDYVVMDLMMPRLGGIEATRQILAEHPETRVIAFTVNGDSAIVQQAFAAGARAYVPKEAVIDDLADALDALRRGQTYISPRSKVSFVHEDQPHRSPLTPREREVLRLLADGKAMKEAAAELKVSIKTIETHRRSMMEKLNLYSTAELTKYAIREGLTSVEV